MITIARPARPAPRLLPFLAAAVLVAIGSYVIPAVIGPADAPVERPRLALPAPGAVSAPLPDDAGRRPLDERLAFWSRRVEEQPADAASWIQLALTRAESARLRYDLDAWVRARAAVDRALELAPASPSGHAVRASIRFATHDFAGAETDAAAALEVAAADPTALAILGDARLELGRPDDAAAAYDRLAEVSGGPALDVRLARLAWIRGDPGTAVALARRALLGASDGGAEGAAAIDVAELAFYHYAVGEYARLTGDAAAAQEAFEAGLSLRPDDVGSLVGWARVAAWLGDADAAIVALERVTAIAPLPEAEALLGDLLAIRGGPGDTAAAGTAHGTVRLTSELSALAGALFDRQLIAFELDHGGDAALAVERAVAALAVRPDAAGHDLLGWALLRAGRLDEAWQESVVARASGPHDARALFHAGAIAAARGETEVARELLSAALALGPALDPIERAEAERRLAELG